MEILGIGPAELAFIIIIALIVLGPKDMQKAGRMLGKWLRQIVTSDGWKLFQQTSREIQQLPTRLMREAGLDEMQKDLKQINLNPSVRLPSQPVSNETPKADPASEPANTILPSPPPPTAEDKNEGDNKE